MTQEALDEAATDRPATRRPVAGAERLVSLDLIRGIALLGILFANIVDFGWPLQAYSWPLLIENPPDPADTAIWLFQLVFIDGKMRGLFTLLFGAGIMLFVERNWARGGTRWLQARRLVLLMAFGLLHFLFLFWGDILLLYGMAGLVALLLVRWSPATQLRVGLLGYVAGGLMFALMYSVPMALERNQGADLAAADAFAPLAAAWEARLAGAAQEAEVFASASYARQVAFVIAERGAILAQSPTYALLETIPLMLIGMACYRFGLFGGGGLDPRRIRLWSWAGIAASAAVMLALGLWVTSRGWPPYLTEFVFWGASQIPRLPMILGFAGLLSLYASKLAESWSGERLVAAGRMAFSNYIGTSLVMMLVFRGWAGGLYGTLDRPGLLLVVLLGWLLILAWSKPWLARFRYGPLEWAWRCLTYGQLFPLRR